MKPPPAGVPWRLTLRLPSSPRAPAAVAGPRGRIDLSTLPCQQPLGHNLNWKRVEPHPHAAPVDGCGGVCTSMRLKLWGVKGRPSMRNGFDRLKKNKLGPRNFQFAARKYAPTRWRWKAKWTLPYSVPTSLNSSKSVKKNSQHNLRTLKNFKCPPSPNTTVERSESAPWQKKNKTLVPACFKHSPTVREPDPEPSRRYQIHIIRSPFPPGCPCCPAPLKAETGAKKKKKTSDAAAGLGFAPPN